MARDSRNILAQTQLHISFCFHLFIALITTRSTVTDTIPRVQLKRTDEFSSLIEPIADFIIQAFIFFILLILFSFYYFPTLPTLCLWKFA
jgi:hypothetical protein